MKGLAVIILAAGEGTRMKSDTAKVLHPLMGKPLVYYALEAAKALEPERLVVVVGDQADQVKAELADQGVRFALQKEQKGTAHAVAKAMPSLKGFKGQVMVIYADTPLVRAKTLKSLAAMHRGKKAAITLMTAKVSGPYGYGRIMRDHKGRIKAIIEEKDCTPGQRSIKEINPGMYCYDTEFLKSALPKVKNKNKQGEYYLTDLVQIAVDSGVSPASAMIGDNSEIMGVNSRWDMAKVTAALISRINHQHARSGVTIVSQENTYIQPGVKIGKDTVVEPGAWIEGRTKIGSGSKVEMQARIKNSKLASGVVVEMCSRIEDSTVEKGARIKTGSVIEESRVGQGSQVGPMAHLRPGSVIGKDARIGNFVETKKALIKEGAKSSHLSYIGDAEVGRRVNLGCGFITCNYDGKDKWKTVIEDHVFVGSDTQTVAPVRIGRGAYIGSGSTIDKDIPQGSLALTRAPLVIKEGWARKKKSSKSSSAKKGKKKSPKSKGRPK